MITYLVITVISYIVLEAIALLNKTNTLYTDCKTQYTLFNLPWQLQFLFMVIISPILLIFTIFGYMKDKFEDFMIYCLEKVTRK